MKTGDNTCCSKPLFYIDEEEFCKYVEKYVSVNNLGNKNECQVVLSSYFSYNLYSEDMKKIYEIYRDNLLDPTEYVLFSDIIEIIREWDNKYLTMEEMLKIIHLIRTYGYNYFYVLLRSVGGDRYGLGEKIHKYNFFDFLYKFIIPIPHRVLNLITFLFIEGNIRFKTDDFVYKNFFPYEDIIDYIDGITFHDDIFFLKRSIQKYEGIKSKFFFFVFILIFYSSLFSVEKSNIFLPLTEYIPSSMRITPTVSNLNIPVDFVYKMMKLLF